MSYSVSTPCYNCKKQKPLTVVEGEIPGTCEDGQEIQAAVNRIHSKQFGTGHQGCGAIVLMCSRLDPKS